VVVVIELALFTLQLPLNWNKFSKLRRTKYYGSLL